ncbi:hypothetical protein NEIELOOT_02610 [Neisseria elongata subsp. glycolytica ATCC 29315]|uniref:Uncharacterized protein n=1 Tax=Neisseria elongata subsp. glycolytica ATCC 29315 TaxID=546263 RepID=D4DU54_NEIEG|nr:hypothetical protein NEIELOOT_02610 [Neisseria elongata subsp. glycolytica ATCC 29315]
MSGIISSDMMSSCEGSWRVCSIDVFLFRFVYLERGRLKPVFQTASI